MAVEDYLKKTLSNSISVFDTRAPEREKESSYHTFLVGLLVGNASWLVKSNVEAGDGFADIIVETEDPDAGIIVELKYAKTFPEWILPANRHLLRSGSADMKNICEMMAGRISGSMEWHFAKRSAK